MRLIDNDAAETSPPKEKKEKKRTPVNSHFVPQRHEEHRQLPHWKEAAQIAEHIYVLVDNDHV
ncbi:MAG: hypothetical protein LBC21_03490 [Oscillospiraceae bacterium]|jgi:hypothetical protein|nr:hypothetical protein [Oscillospiraceae bacterium]